MKQDDKELLLKDLCSRLPYGVKCEVIKYRIDGEMVFIRNSSSALELTVDNVKELVTNNLYTIKPYLLPLSSMTEEQSIEYGKLCERYCSASIYSMEIIDWFNKNHFDYRGLIPMGLAEDATGLDIY